MPERSLKAAAVKLPLRRLVGQRSGQLRQFTHRLRQKKPVRRDRRDPPETLDAPEKPGQLLGLDIQLRRQLAHPRRPQPVGSEQRPHPLPEPFVLAIEPRLMRRQPQHRRRRARPARPPTTAASAASSAASGACPRSRANNAPRVGPSASGWARCHSASTEAILLADLREAPGADRDRRLSAPEAGEAGGIGQILHLGKRQVARPGERRQWHHARCLDQVFERVPGIGFGHRGKRGQPFRTRAPAPRRRDRAPARRPACGARHGRG